MVSGSMATLRPDNWSELQEALFVDAWAPTVGRHRSPYAFRGLSDTSHRLETTLIRLGGNFEDLERTSCATSGSTSTGMWSSGTRCGTGSRWRSATGYRRG
jgi:hypothetical protein